MQSAITHKAITKSVKDLWNLHEDGHLNLNPGFQRKSVWKERDRSKLIDSILRNYPLPAVFLYRRNDDGYAVFDVIDGKQRIESIFMFAGKLRGKFATKTQLPNTDEETRVDWSLLNRKRLQHLIESYELPVIEVDGQLSQIIEVFVRINSTGKALTQQEKRHARYSKSAFLKEATRLAKRYEKYFLANKIFSVTELDRMKHVEFVCELMLSLAQGGVLNKKTALDKVMANEAYDGRTLKAASKSVTSVLNRIGRMFPQLKTTRLRQLTDFYSLSVLIGKFEKEGFILTDRKRNALAWDLLSSFAARVDEVRELQRSVKGIRPEQELFRAYLITVSQMTDDISQRKKREQILDGILRSLFAAKETQRGFTSEQRRIIWNTTANRVCTYPGCSSKLTWEDFTIDHIHPHSKGGKNQLSNAAIMCRPHNSSKGNRKLRAR